MAYKPSLNDCKFIGRLGRDPEVRYTTTQKAVMNFSMAVDESYKDQQGTWQERTTWIDVVVWGKRAEALHQFMTKGALVFVAGKLSKRSWDGKNGKVYVTEIVVQSQGHDVIILRNAGEGGSNGGARSSGGQGGPGNMQMGVDQGAPGGDRTTQRSLPLDGKKPPAAPGKNAVPDIPDDDLPF